MCETWFSPAMAGVDSAGLGEVLQNVLARFSDSDKGRLVKVGCRLGVSRPTSNNFIFRTCS